MQLDKNSAIKWSSSFQKENEKKNKTKKGQNKTKRQNLPFIFWKNENLNEIVFVDVVEMDHALVSNKEDGLAMNKKFSWKLQDKLSTTVMTYTDYL